MEPKAGRLPAVISPCGHSPEGKAAKTYQICHVNLVRRGYVVMSYDPVGQGERSQCWDATHRKSRYNLTCGEHAVLGNPPWERIKLQEQEFFAHRAPEIAAAPNAAARGRMIKALEDAPEGSPERRLHDAFQLAKRIAEASSLFFTAPKDEEPPPETAVATA